MMRIVWSVLCAVGLSAATAAGLSADCQFCMSGVVYCSVVQDYPHQYTEEAQEACEEDRDLLIDIHAFDPEWGDCDGGGLSFREEDGQAELVARSAALGGGGGGWECRACGYESDCHTKSDIGECHEGCVGSSMLMARVDEAVASGSEEALAQLVLAEVNVEFIPEAGALRVFDLCDGWEAGPVETIPLDRAVAVSLSDRFAAAEASTRPERQGGLE